MGNDLSGRLEEKSKLIDEHKKLEDLVRAGVLIPGVFTGKVGSMMYTPISVEEYLSKITIGDIKSLSYNTKTMGRGIFTLDKDGRIINYKGVDSHLDHSESIAIATTEGSRESITTKPSYSIWLARFIDRNKKYPNGKERIEIRVQGASQFQNIIAEKNKRDWIEKNDKQHIIKLPTLDMPTPFSEEFCERFDLPKAVPITYDFLSTLESGSYAKYCYDYLKSKGIALTNRNQLWREYFEERNSNNLQDKAFQELLTKEDNTYGLGAMFGQTTRILDNPFRIMELDYYIKTNNVEAVKALIEYSIQRCNGNDLLEQYAVISSRNAAGFMNLNLSFNNFEHRQDFPLSGEICDDAYDNVSKSLNTTELTDGDKYKILQYRNQVYLWITNMKIIENAYRLIGRAIPDGYKESFIRNFYNALDQKEKFRECFESPNPMEAFKIINNAEKNFEGMEEVMQEYREIAISVYKEKRNVQESSAADCDDSFENR